MSELLGILFSSLFLGTALGLMALAFTVGYTVSQVFNFAVGQVMLLGGLLVSAVQLTNSLALNDILAVVIVGLIGAGVYILTLRWPESHGASPLTLVMVTFGIGMVIEQLAIRKWGSDSRTVPSLLSGHFTVDGLYVPQQGLLLVLVALVLVVFFGWAQRHTNVGRQLLALGSARASAKYYGINDLGMVTLAWIIAFGVLAIVGVLYLPLTGVSMSADLTYGIDAFAAAVVGGLGNPAGALAGGLIVALVVNLVGVYITPNVAHLLTFGVLLGFLVLRPNGLTGNKADLVGPRA